MTDEAKMGIHGPGCTCGEDGTRALPERMCNCGTVVEAIDEAAALYVALTRAKCPVWAFQVLTAAATIAEATMEARLLQDGVSQRSLGFMDYISDGLVDATLDRMEERFGEIESFIQKTMKSKDDFKPATNPSDLP